MSTKPPGIETSVCMPGLNSMYPFLNQSPTREMAVVLDRSGPRLLLRALVMLSWGPVTMGKGRETWTKSGFYYQNKKGTKKMLSRPWWCSLQQDMFFIIILNNNSNKSYSNFMLFPKYFVPLTSGHMVALYFLVPLWDHVTRSGQWPVNWSDMCDLGAEHLIAYTASPKSSFPL